MCIVLNVCVCVCASEREKERERLNGIVWYRMCLWERMRELVWYEMCAWDNERERERGKVTRFEWNLCLVTQHIIVINLYIKNSIYILYVMVYVCICYCTVDMLPAHTSVKCE